MKFSLVEYTSEEITSKSSMIVSISNEIEANLINKDYGSIDSLFIGVICVHPQFEKFFPFREKYTKSKKMLEYSLKLDYESFKNSNEKKATKIIIQNILYSIEKIIIKLKINNFNVTSFKEDLKQLSIKKKWINE